MFQQYRPSPPHSTGRYSQIPPTAEIAAEHNVRVLTELGSGELTLKDAQRSSNDTSLALPITESGLFAPGQHKGYFGTDRVGARVQGGN